MTSVIDQVRDTMPALSLNTTGQRLLVADMISTVAARPQRTRHTVVTEPITNAIMARRNGIVPAPREEYTDGDQEVKSCACTLQHHVRTWRTTDRALEH